MPKRKLTVKVKEAPTRTSADKEHEKVTTTTAATATAAATKKSSSSSSGDPEIDALFAGKKRSSTNVQEQDAKEKSSSGGGLLDIDALFDSKKKQKKQQQATLTTSAATASAKHETTPNSAKITTQRLSLKYDRSDLSNLQPKEWADDGLGGKFNKDGFTGRKEQGVKVFKAHLFNKKDFGRSPDCPFDCDCCFI